MTSTPTLEELDYALRPHVHEGRPPRFGALIAAASSLDPADLMFPAIVEPTDVDLRTVRRLADGRTSFVARTRTGAAVVSFDRTIEHEATAVRVAQASGTTLIQRRSDGVVRVFSSGGAITWDGTRWWVKPMATQLAGAVAAVRPDLDGPVLAGLAEFCVHWLSPGRVGALLVWHTSAGAAPGHLGFGAAITIPPLDFARREHFPAALSVLAQTDRAALVGPHGRVEHVGVALRWSDEAIDRVAPYRGTRHTSARRFSYDEPTAVVFATSSSGPVSVFGGGDVIAAA